MEFLRGIKKSWRDNGGGRREREFCHSQETWGQDWDGFGNFVHSLLPGEPRTLGHVRDVQWIPSVPGNGKGGKDSSWNSQPWLGSCRIGQELEKRGKRRREIPFQADPNSILTPAQHGKRRSGMGCKTLPAQIILGFW